MTPEAHVCKTCGSEVRAPGYLGRSWCEQCEEYEGPVEVVPEYEESDDLPSSDGP